MVTCVTLGVDEQKGDKGQDVEYLVVGICSETSKLDQVTIFPESVAKGSF